MFQQPRTQLQQEYYVALRDGAIREGIIKESLAEKIQKQPFQMSLTEMYNVIRDESIPIPNLITAQQMEEMYRTDYEVALQVKQEKKHLKDQPKPKSNESAFDRLYNNNYSKDNEKRRELRKKVEELNKSEQRQERRKTVAYQPVTQAEKQVQISELKVRYLQDNIRQMNELTQQYQKDIEEQLKQNLVPEISNELRDNNEYLQLQKDITKLERLKFENLNQNLNNTLNSRHQQLETIRQHQKVAEKLIQGKIQMQKQSISKIMEEFHEYNSSTTQLMKHIDHLKSKLCDIKVDTEMAENINLTYTKQNFDLERKIWKCAKDLNQAQPFKPLETTKIKKTMSLIPQQSDVDTLYSNSHSVSNDETNDIIALKESNNESSEYTDEYQGQVDQIHPIFQNCNFQTQRPASGQNMASFLLTQDYQLEKQLQSNQSENQLENINNISHKPRQTQKIQEITQMKNTLINNCLTEENFIETLTNILNEQLVEQIDNQTEIRKTIKYKKQLYIIKQALSAEKSLLLNKNLIQLNRLQNMNSVNFDANNQPQKAYNVEDDLVVFKSGQMNNNKQNQANQQKQTSKSSLVGYLFGKK